MPASRYLFSCIGITLLYLVLFGTFNFIMDPYGLYHDGKSWDWTHDRKGINHFLFGYKARSVQKFRPEAVLLGNSRVLYGLNPSEPDLPPKTYNLAVEASNIYVEWRYLQHVSALHPPSLVILGIDPEMFDAHGLPPPTFMEERLQVTADGRSNPLCHLADLPGSLLSTTALYYSFKGLFPRDIQHPYTQGYDSQAMLDLNKMNLAHNVFSSNQKWLVPYTSSFRDQDGKEPQMAAFDQIVSYCSAHQLHLMVFVNPRHASMTDINTENWPEYVAWMKGVVEAMPPQNKLWDFTGYNAFNTENFPAPTDQYSHMHYFWECSHYKEEVGNLVLQRMLTGKGPTAFGQEVDAGNLSADLARIQTEKDNWHRLGRPVSLIPSHDD